MLPPILLILGLLLVAVGSIADLWWREVPDWNNYFGIAAALMIRTVYSLGTGSWTWILEGLLGLGAMYCLACGLFYLGQWGGGDSKLLMALGAVFGLGMWNREMLGSFLVNLVFFGGVWGGFWSIQLAAKHGPAVCGAFKALMRKHAVLHAKTMCYLAAVAMLAGAFAFPAFSARLPLIILAITAIVTFYTWGFAKAVESACFIKNVPVKELEEGDWIQHDIVVKGKLLCGPRDLGVSREQIKSLQRARVKSVIVKEGVPFVPGFFFAYVATLLVGNAFLEIVRLAS